MACSFLYNALQVDGEASSVIVNYLLEFDGNLKLTMNVLLCSIFKILYLVLS